VNRGCPRATLAQTNEFLPNYSSVILADQVVALDNTFERLMGTKSLKCTFEKGTSANWKGETVKIEPDDSLDTLHFDSIDLKAKTARLIANAGAGDVTMLWGASGLTFIERTGLGNFAFTTIFPIYKQGTTEFIAVTSRHMNLLKYPLPSQYHGTCKVWE
jgi:hypothetical protein